DHNPGLASDRDYAGSPPPIRLVPEEPVAGFSFMQEAHGPWTLLVIDDKAGDAGTLHGWAMDITTVPDFEFAIEGVPPEFTNPNPQVISDVGTPVIQCTIAIGGMGG